MSPAPQKWSPSAVRMIWPTFARVADNGDDDGVSHVIERPPVGTQHELRQAADR